MIVARRGALALVAACVLSAGAVEGVRHATGPRRGSLLPKQQGSPLSASRARPWAGVSASAQSAARTAAGVAIAIGLTLSPPPPAGALDSLKVGECVLQNCALPLARCIADVNCAANLVCLNLCNGKPDETGCEIKCGDQFEDKVVEAFNTCAVSNKKCVPQEQDKGQYPVPPQGATVPEFDLKDFTGVWYITAGQNPLFDIFPCQRHVFSNPEPGKLRGDLAWRVKTSYGVQLERSAVQEFVQDKEAPGILYNHDNEFLHYQDDWYVLDYKPDAYALIYYRGQNDAWDGYGGAVLYTRAAKLPREYVPALKEACAKVPGLSWSDFKQTDNSCPKLEQEVLKEELEKDATILRLDIEELENDVEVGLFGLPREINKDLQIIEKDVEEEVTFIEGLFGKLFSGGK